MTTRHSLVKSSLTISNANWYLVQVQRFVRICQHAVDYGVQQIFKKAVELNICLGLMEQSAARICGVRKVIALHVIDLHWFQSTEIGANGASKYFFNLFSKTNK